MFDDAFDRRATLIGNAEGVNPCGQILDVKQACAVESGNTATALVKHLHAAYTIVYDSDPTSGWVGVEGYVTETIDGANAHLVDG